MRLKSLLFLLSITTFFPFTSHAKEVAGLSIPETISFSSQSTKLMLNGAGIRAKFIYDIYVGSLYLEKKYHSEKDIYNAHGEKRISMHFLYDEISKEKLINGWNDGFNNNLTKDELKKFKTQIDQFNALFVSVKKGDVINIDLIPTTGTRVVLNNNTLGLIKGDEFFTALLKIWLGDEPADSNLKEAMLGTS